MTVRQDMRAFLQFVRERCPAEHYLIEKTVSPDWELAAIVAKLEAKKRAPVLEFRDVAGTALPVVTNIGASLVRVAKSVGITVAQLEERMVLAYDRPIQPRVLASQDRPPVRDQLYRGEEVDLMRLPQLRYTATEPAPYLTASVVVARHPDTGSLNLSFHRLMIIDRTRTAIFMTPEGHLEQIYKANAERAKPTPIAVFMGCHPLWALGVLASGRPDTDEFGVIGALLAEPIDVVSALVDPRLRIPAYAEIVLEGHLLANETTTEGPYGEALGYVAEASEQPVFSVEIMSTRTSPIYQDIVAGRLEHLIMTGAAFKAYLQWSLVRADLGIIEIHVPAALTLFVRIDSAAGNVDVPSLIATILRERYVKQVYVFDNDVQLRSSRSTQLAFAPIAIS